MPRPGAGDLLGYRKDLSDPNLSDAKNKLTTTQQPCSIWVLCGAGQAFSYFQNTQTLLPCVNILIILLSE